MEDVRSPRVLGTRVYQAPRATTLRIEVLQAATAARLKVASGPLAEHTSFFVLGNVGSELLEFPAGTCAMNIASGVNRVASRTGVLAQLAADQTGALTLVSAEIGSSAMVELDLLEGEIDVGVGSAAGQDLVANVVGSTIRARGNVLSIRTDTIKADIILAPDCVGLIEQLVLRE